MIFIILLIIANIFSLAFLMKKSIAQAQEGKRYSAQSVESLSKQIDYDGEVMITADTDQGRETTAPMVAMVGRQILLNANQQIEGSTIEIIGNNGFAEYPNETSNGFIWIPKRTGIFQVNLVNKDGQVLVSRNINVSDIEGGSSYQLGDLKSSADHSGNVTFNTSIFSKPKNTEGNAAEGVIAFTIGEDGIWSKRIRDYTSDETSIKEGKDFKLDRGNYSIRAALRDKYSIDDEDYKNIEYEKAAADGHKVQINHIEHTVINNENGTQSDKFVVDAYCDHGCDLVYAFFVDDSVGEKRTTEGLNGYQESNVFTCPTTGWEYTFTAKVKHKENAQTDLSQDDVNVLKLPNAYEAVSSVTVAGTVGYEELKIDKIEIEPFILENYYQSKKSSKQIILDGQQSATVYANNNNYITIYLNEAGVYQYSVSVNDDGESIKLSEVVNSSDKQTKTFVYYPKSGGSAGKAANSAEVHTLTISVSELDELGYVKKKAIKTLSLEVN